VIEFPSSRSIPQCWHRCCCRDSALSHSHTARSRTMTTIHDLGWWYWLLTVCLLGAGLLGWVAGIYLAILLCAVQIVHVIWLTRDLTTFPIQVRVAYLAMLIGGLWEPLSVIH